MMKMRQIVGMCACLLVGAPLSASAQDTVLIPSQMELSEEQQKDLQAHVDKELLKVVTTCVGKYDRPEFYTSLSIGFELRKSGELRGSYVPAGVVDSNMFVKSDEERAKLEEAGSFARLVVSSDRDLERCMMKATREFSTKLDGYTAEVAATYSITWSGKKPTMTASEFLVTKKN